MRSFAFALCLALLGSFATAQIDDARAIALARPIVARFAPEALDAKPQVRHESMPKAPGGPVESVCVVFGRVGVWFEGAGEFTRFVSGITGQPKGSAPTKYKTDAEAWKAVEAVLVGFDVPEGLTNKRLQRSTRNGEPSTIWFTLEPQPYGYEANEGNFVRATIHQKSGRLMRLEISRGWTHEPPNVRISPEQVIETVRLAHGGKAKDWKASLSYFSAYDPYATGQQSVIPTKTKRLFYSLWSNRGTARADSVTGKIIDFQAPLRTSVYRAPPANPKPKPAPVIRPEPISSNQEKTVGMWRGILAAVVLLLILGGGALARSVRLSN